ncbi:MAG: winged helix-turn-helix transcriptional regulator [Nitrosopumilaceae archaeon]|uniref:Winged helix-turn-helix transcriptional regulator n=1 Tax=Candidatus Nitrosomaritimum aestuariumsis TaxID=3342354 RepID=A0AC60WBL8_9ARCH|nr:winged helix-turn-helix transcriptional regulator [Nitrosopumilaceae archaeon]MBA4462176.1 winged helix-turn-helix transcriptional regulator [Nitrosopumilaceae archaeon]MBA4464345.1 winged helix-turn-helix transcriptional regulator [Nitrosopumilaceae archaeon]
MTDRNLQLQEIIEKNPGIQFREIMRNSGLKNGVLSHYLGKLEKNGLVKVMRGPRQTRFYPPKTTEDESIVIKALRKQTPRDLLLALVENDGLEFSELVKKVGKSPSTVSLYLSQIVQDGLVEIKLEKLKKRYYIKARDLIDQLIEDYRPSLLEKPVSGFEDIFNSL